MEMRASHAMLASKFAWVYGERERENDISYTFPSVIPFSFAVIAVLCEVHKQEARLH